MTLLYLKREWLMFQLILLVAAENILSAILPEE